MQILKLQQKCHFHNQIAGQEQTNCHNANNSYVARLNYQNSKYSTPSNINAITKQGFLDEKGKKNTSETRVL